MIQEYRIVSLRVENPLIGTYGFEPCVAVTFYNPKTRQATVAHFDFLTNSHDIYKIISRLGGNNENKIEIRMFGGNI